MNAIRAKLSKTVGHCLKHPEQSHNIVSEGVIEGKKTAERNSYVGRIKSDARGKTFKEIKEKANNRSEWSIGVLSRRSG